MSDIDDTGDDERTDPSVALPREGRALKPSTLPPIGARLSALPPRTSSPPLAPSPPRASPSPRPPSLPPRLAPPPLPGARAGSIPPSALPKPSDPPRADRGEASAAQRQQLALLTTQLEAARSTASRQQSELDALRARIDEQGARLGELRAPPSEESEPLEPRLSALEERGAGLAEALRRLEEQRGSGDLRESAARLTRIEERVRTLEEHDGEARIRMRLERATHRLDDLEQRLGVLEAGQEKLAAVVATASERDAAREERLLRIESLFEELAGEVRAERDALDLDGVRARLDDVETLVLSAGNGEATLKKVLDEHARTLESLRESMAPPPGDDLTRIKGVGPKYARLLRDLGTSSFAEIAAWTEEDLDRVAEALGIPAARVRKWVDAAADLALR